MAIRLKVNKKDQERVRALGACWFPEEKTWVIPDDVRDINPFMEWLPGKECMIVQRPYFVTRAKMNCYQCGKETPIIALGVKFGQELVYETATRSVWRRWDCPMQFIEIEFLDPEVVKSLQDYYPFFQLIYSKPDRRKIWGNTCVHCHALQEENLEFVFEANPLSPLTLEEAREIRIVYFKLKYDYQIRAGYSISSIFDEIFEG